MIYPLAFICTSFLFGSFLSAMSDYKEALVFIILIIISLSVTAIIVRKSKGVLLLLCLASFITGAIYLYGYSQFHICQIKDYYNTEITVSGKVTDIIQNGFVIKSDTINGKKINGTIKFNVYNYNDINCDCGDNVMFCGKLKSYNLSAFYGGFNARKYNMTNKVYGHIYTEGVEVIKNGKDVFYSIRTRMSDSISYNFGGDKGEFLKALLIGDKSGFSNALKTNLMKSSLSHVAVVSGLHLSILISFAGVFAAFLKRHKVLYVAVMLILLGLFVGIIGQHPSVLRAVVMATYCLIAVFLNKRYDAFTALTFSAVLLVVINPFYVQSVSFQLSYAATFAIIVTINKEGRHVLLTTVSVFLITLPLCMYYFNFASLAMFFTNLLVTPIVSILLPVGYLMQIFPFLRYFAGALIDIMLIIIEAFGSFDILNIKAAVPSVFIILVMYTAAGAFLSLVIFGRKRFAAIMLVVSMSCFVAGCFKPDDYIKVFNDGDNVVHIKSLKGKNIICTAGYDNIESYVNKHYIECIDALILTKLPDNFDLKNIRIKKLYLPEYNSREISGDFSIKYYDTEVIEIDGATITPVSFMPYKSKVDEKRPVLHISYGGKSILFEPYVNDELNKEYLSTVEADIVVLKDASAICKRAEFVIGSGLQPNENVIYYDTEKSGSIVFYDDKIKTLR